MKRIISLLGLSLLLPLGFVSVAHASSDIVNQTPVNGALGVSATSAITVVFDRNIFATSTDIAFSPSIPFSFSTSSDTLIITPSAPLASNTTYTLTLANIKDASGNVLSSYQSQFTTQDAYSVPLYANTNGGLNLISLPAEPSNTAIASVLGSAASSIDSVWTYDPSNPSANSSGWLVYYPAQPSLSDLTTMSTGKGYWIQVNSNTVITGVGSLLAAGNATPPSRSLKEGWNLVGYYDLPGQSSSDSTSAFSSVPGFTTLIGYDNPTGTFKAVSSILPGDAFWIGMPAAGTYYPSYSPSIGSGGGTFGPPLPPTTVKVTVDPSSPNQNIAVGATNVDWANFDTLASGENVKINDLYVYTTNSSTTYSGLQNGKIMVNGVLVGSTKNIGEGSGSATDFGLGSALILPAGQTTVVSIYADAKDSAGANLPSSSTVQVTLAAGSNNAQGKSSLRLMNVPAADTSGNTVTVTASSLIATKYTGYGNETVVPGAQSAKLGAFNLSAGSAEGVTVNTIEIDFQNATAAASTTNLTLKDDATGNVLGSVITTPSTTNSFAVNLDIPASSSKTIDIYGNVSPRAGVGNLQLSVGEGATGTGDTTGTQASVGTTVGLQTMSVGAVTLTASVGAGNPVSTNYVAGSTMDPVGEFNFAATNSSYTVQNLAVLVPNGAATSVTSVTLQYKDVNGATQTVSQPLQVVAGKAYATATFSGLTMYVPANDSSNADVFVGIPTIASGATSGAAVSVKLDTGNSSTAVDNTFRAINTAGTQLTYVNGGTPVSTGSTFYVRKSIPTFAMVSTGNTVPTSGSPLYKFSITADPAGAVEWSKLTFNMATSGMTVSNVYLTDDSTGNSLLDTGKYATLNSVAGTATVNLLNNGTQAKYQQIAAGATKTYDLYGTVNGFTRGSTLTISLASDTGTPVNKAATTTAASNNISWSDRSASGHSLTTTDWTNGYLLKNFTSSAISYSK